MTGTIKRNGAVDISNLFTTTDYVSNFKAYATDSTVTISCLVKKGVTDQAHVLFIPATYRPKNYEPLSVFYMNSEDFGRNVNAYATAGYVEIRLNGATTGSSGVVIGGTWVY